ncbi:uncharacterized protein LOC111988074 [Quercus suber]|uniref:uncharacterized protein LOC111988074 n=1 Tax=Quercus suber TaxID=58331 RepID=UPI000CE1A292|nr:uncharacterized protein LOC111988074 [Quercus suber]
MDAMSRALRRAARSSFSDNIERAPMPSRFTRPSFNIYDGKMDLVEHASHYIHMISLHSHNDALMCKVFPSSLGLNALRWFNGLRKGSINFFAKLIQVFGGGNEKIAASTFRMGLPEDSELWESLTKKPSKDMRQLMRRIKEYKHLVDDRLQNKGKAPLINRPRQSGFQLRPRKDLRIYEPQW